jgi:hypothetical protein
VYVIFPFLDIAYTIFIINAAARNKLLLPLLSSQFLRHYLIVHDLYRTFFPTDDNVSRYYKLMINHEVPLSSSLGIALDYHTRFSLSKTRFSWIKRIYIFRRGLVGLYEKKVDAGFGKFDRRVQSVETRYQVVSCTISKNCSVRFFFPS